jgi:GNAT superfamily N-acetyltransferase
MSNSGATRPEVTVRNTQPEDFPQIIEMTREVYHESPSWSKAQLTSHLEVFPEGQLVALEEKGGRILGMAASLIVLWDDYDMTASWRDFTEHGMFTNHDPENGRTLYGAEVMVRPNEQRRGIGQKLYAGRRDIVRRLSLLRIRAGARLAGYYLHADRLTPEQYVKKVVAGEVRDLALSFQLKQGFVPLAVAPDYLHHDPESLGFAAVIEWLNPEVATPENYSRQEQRFRTQFP